MGILNLTPDSFFDGGKYSNATEVLKQVEKMLSEGASVIDVGAMSSRPGSTIISEEEELKRSIPLIEDIITRFPQVILSIDTLRSKVAKEAIYAGAAIVNDISGGNFDSKMFQTVAQLGCPYILMHMQGSPENMQKSPTYENVTVDVAKEISGKIIALQKLNVHDIIIDPGFGFGKTQIHNYQLLKELSHFKHLFDLPILVGISRKGMIWKTLNIDVESALNGTTAANMIALMNGASILRVHDVKEAMETIEIYKQTYLNV